MKKYDKILSILIIISGAFALVCYVSYFIKLFVYPEGTLPIIACVTVILGVCLPISLDKYIRKLTKKAYPVLKTVYCAALCFYMVTFTAMSVFVYSGVSSGPAPEKLPPDTVFVTFGAKIKPDSTPGKALMRRLDKTIELMSYCPDSVCIVTGGKGVDEPESEAEAMRKYLVAKGIPDERIIVEDQAKDTIQNVEFSKKLITERGLEGRTVACVSTGFHIPRIMHLTSKADFGEYFYRAPGSNFYIEFTSVVREYMSYVKLFVRGY